MGEYIFIFLTYVLDTEISFLVAAFFLFAILDEKTDMQSLGKLLLFGGLPCGTVNFFIYRLADVVGGEAVYLAASLVVAIVGTITVSHIWKYNIWQSVSLFVIAGMLQVADANIVSATLYYFAEHYLTENTQIYIWKYIMSAGYVLAAWSGGIVIRKMRFSKLIRYLIEDEQHIRFTAVLVIVLESTMEIFYLMKMHLKEEAVFAYNVAVFILALLILCILIDVSDRVKNAHKIQVQKAMILQQQMYMDHLEEMQKEVRRFRHDYKNMLSGLYVYAKEGKSDKIQEALEKLEIDFDQKIGEKIHMTVQVGNIRIPEIKSLVLTKLTKMNQDGIACRLEALYPVESVGMDIWDFNRCLGILLDNAMEAAKLNENPCIELQLLHCGGYLTVRVTNPWEQEVDVSGIWTEGYSTKGASRGMGLSIYRKILSRYPDAVPVTSCENHLFVQEFTIAA